MGIMAVPQADGGDDPSKVTIRSLHAVRLLLDYARDVDEAVALLQDYTVSLEGGPPVHCLVSGPSGNSAALEFLCRKVQVIRNSHPRQVASNLVISGTAPEKRGCLCARYGTAYQTLKGSQGSICPDQAMPLLEQVSQAGDYPTIWSVVYNMTGGDIRAVVGREYD
jgi:hypothetical protein